MFIHLYSATLLNLFISSSSFCVESLGFSTDRIMSPVYNDNFTFFLPIWVLFISFSCLIAVVRTPNTVLNGKVRVGIFVLVQILAGRLSAEYYIGMGLS